MSNIEVTENKGKDVAKSDNVPYDYSHCTYAVLAVQGLNVRESRCTLPFAHAGDHSMTPIDFRPIRFQPITPIPCP